MPAWTTIAALVIGAVVVLWIVDTWRIARARRKANRARNELRLAESRRRTS